MGALRLGGAWAPGILRVQGCGAACARFHSKSGCGVGRGISAHAVVLLSSYAAEVVEPAGAGGGADLKKMFIMIIIIMLIILLCFRLLLIPSSCFEAGMRAARDPIVCHKARSHAASAQACLHTRAPANLSLRRCLAGTLAVRRFARTRAALLRVARRYAARRCASLAAARPASHLRGTGLCKRGSVRHTKAPPRVTRLAANQGDGASRPMLRGALLNVVPPVLHEARMFLAPRFGDRLHRRHVPASPPHEGGRILERVRPDAQKERDEPALQAVRGFHARWRLVDRRRWTTSDVERRPTGDRPATDNRLGEPWRPGSTSAAPRGRARPRTTPCRPRPS